MAQFRSEFLNVLQARGFIHQCSDPAGLDGVCAATAISGYIGFDCTAPSLHAGSLLPIMMLYWMQHTGHRPIVLMGGGTTRIGDPSGKEESRRLLTPEQIDANKAGIKQVFQRFLRFGDGTTDAVMVDNADWLLEINYVDFLREVGRHFSVNQMIQRDTVRLRLEREQHLSFLEFNYMVLQAYDFVELYRRYGCRLQMGGSDQWGNIVSGIDLARRTEEAQLFALTAPLLTTASGAKMGKTAEGAVWLSPDMLSPYEYWQYWRNVEDADVGRFLRLFTTLPLDRIEYLAKREGAELNEAKKELATEATALLHGREAAEQAAETARQTFEKGQAGEALPTVRIPEYRFEEGIGVLTLFVDVGLASSNSEVRRAVANNAVSINDVRVADPQTVITLSDLKDGKLKLSIGRKRHKIAMPD